ncbi:secreted protein, partial [mine drainage metagenome]
MNRSPRLRPLVCALLPALCCLGSTAAVAGTRVPMLPPGNALNPQSPFATLYLPENLPSAADASVGPSAWTHAYGSPQHNAALPAAGLGTAVGRVAGGALELSRGARM